LKRFTVKSADKAGLRNPLEMLQVNQQTLFPDLDNLASYIVECQTS